jgi:hypothetical protein
VRRPSRQLVGQQHPGRREEDAAQRRAGRHGHAAGQQGFRGAVLADGLELQFVVSGGEAQVEGEATAAVGEAGRVGGGHIGPGLVAADGPDPAAQPGADQNVTAIAAEAPAAERDATMGHEEGGQFVEVENRLAGGRRQMRRGSGQGVVGPG